MSSAFVVTEASVLNCSFGGTVTMTGAGVATNTVSGAAKVVTSVSLINQAVVACGHPTTPCTKVASYVSGAATKLTIGGVAVAIVTTAWTSDQAHPVTVTTVNQVVYKSL